jgi:RHH-type proline utilization regulon transcriptional repressor/proline dehydrogenase/delta 1-pyrroline-5-carboxylate dehydrogenase
MSNDRTARLDDRSADDRRAVEAAVALAERLLRTAIDDTRPPERRQARRLGRLLGDPGGRELLFALTDEVLRTEDPTRAMGQLRTLVGHGLPHALGILDRTGMRLAALGSSATAGPVASVVRRRIRAETRGVVIPAADPALAEHIAARRAAGFGVNLNVLGEAILGDGEADARLAMLCRYMRRPDVDYVSVKISALCANLDVLAFDHEVDRICDRLRTIYRTAKERSPAVFVNLDMEEYRDLDLTVAAFQRVLDETEFHDLPAGIVLQAYLPDSHAVADELVKWAGSRRRRGAPPIKVRLVKGANLAMEHVDAELGGWEPAPYPSKSDVDSSFKAILERFLEAAAAGDVHVGVASHNLFDVAWALVRRDSDGLAAEVGIEMLEGMAPPQSRAVGSVAGDVVLYTPVVTDQDFAASIAYLTRRLDENAGPENFLRSLFTLEPGTPLWERERERFELAVTERHTVSTATRRTQDRRRDQRRFDPEAPFDNEPDTDFTRPANRAWIADHLADYRPAPLPELITTTAGIDDVVARATAGAERWADTSTAERRRALTRFAEALAGARGRLIAVMAHAAAKTVHEGDPEVSEAIDFARWAAIATRTLDALAADGVTSRPLGVVLAAGPWNFPLAIPTNGVVAALAGGNAVLLKPAPETVTVGVEIVRLAHEAGIPDDVVQLVRCPDDDTGRHLVTHDGVGSVVLTGAYDTARTFLGWKPQLRLIAETSGKNALVITQTADVDLALRDLVRSAFGHAGQKCSAASLAIVEAPLFDDPAFRARLADVVRSARVGPATELATIVGPLIDRPSDKLRRGLTELDDGETWLVRPEPLGGDERTWTPGVRWGVQPGSWFHRTECFGPVLGVMRADDLAHAIELQNAVDYGLTGGIHALDEAEIDHWLERVQVGNAYVNRHTTGAIVQRQPFGGWKRSSIGRGAKTGGPGDVLRFVRHEASAPPDRAAATESYRHWWAALFGVETDRAGLRAEANVLRYRPVRGVIVRAGPSTTADEIELLRLAAERAGAPWELSAPPGLALTGATVEGDGELAARIARSGTERLRTLGRIDDELAEACHAADVAVDDTAVTGHGRVELACWLREQAISRTLHRHGRLPG